MKRSKAGILILLTTLLAACGPSQSAVSTAIEGTLQGWTAISTPTFRPTYTYPPTQTRYPTYTHFPTSTATTTPTHTPWVCTDPLNYTGSYSRDDYCSLNVVQDAACAVRVSLLCSIGPPSYNMGLYYGKLQLQNGAGSVTMKESGGTCVLSFAFSRNAVIVTQDSESPFDCGFGGRVYAGGTYPVTSRARPPLLCGLDGKLCNE